MGHMNYKRVLGGGLVAGVIFVIADALFPMVFSGAAQAWLEAMNFTAPAGGAMVAAIILTLALGVITVWLYAAIRPRYGAGASTAAIAGLAVWALVVVFPSFSFAVLGAPVDFGFWVYMVWWLVFAIAGTLAGARAYHEVGASESTGAAAMAPAMDD